MAVLHFTFMLKSFTSTKPDILRHVTDFLHKSVRPLYIPAPQPEVIRTESEPKVRK